MTIKPDNIKKLLTVIANSNEPPSRHYVKSAVGSFGNEDVFNRTLKFCIENNLIKDVTRALNKDTPTQLTGCLEIMDRGVDYLIEEKRIEEQRKHDVIIVSATIVIAISAVANFVISAFK